MLGRPLGFSHSSEGCINASKLFISHDLHIVWDPDIRMQTRIPKIVGLVGPWLPNDIKVQAWI